MSKEKPTLHIKDTKQLPPTAAKAHHSAILNRFTPVIIKDTHFSHITING